MQIYKIHHLIILLKIKGNYHLVIFNNNNRNKNHLKICNHLRNYVIIHSNKCNNNNNNKSNNNNNKILINW